MVGWWNRICCLVHTPVAIVDIVILYNFLNVYFVVQYGTTVVSPTTSWLVIVLLWTASKKHIWSLMYVFFHITEVKSIVLSKRFFLSGYLFLFNYCTTSYYTVFSYTNCTIWTKIICIPVLMCNSSPVSTSRQLNQIT